MCGIIASIALSTSYCLACPKEQGLPGDGQDSLSNESLADSLHHSLTNGFHDLLANCFVCTNAIKDQTTNGKSSQNNKSDGAIRKKMAWSPGHAKKHLLESKLLAGLDKIHHRGPDSRGTWINQSNTIAFGHCRLSLNDLTPTGRQPLHSPDQLVHAVINGELYDYDILRQLCIDRIGYRFQGHSDSELVIALYKVFGAPTFLNHLRGEFSFVLYDEERQQVLAGRDRYGIKPLFWTVIKGHDQERRLLFASEAKAFLPLGWTPEWDTKSIATGAFDYDDERTLFKDIRKVRPGHIITINSEGMSNYQYWDMDYSSHKAHANELSSSLDQITLDVDHTIIKVREELVDSVRRRMHADVPVGIYLSGGLDSSAIAGIASQLRQQEGTTNGNGTKSGMECFCISFGDDSDFDEANIAQRTADHLGLHLNRCKVDEAALADNFEETTWHNERHSLDLGTVGKYCLSRKVQETGYKAILSGEGADEIFGGYPWFLVDMFESADSVDTSETQLHNSSQLYERVREAIVTRFRQMMGEHWDPLAVSPELLSELGHNYGFIASIMWGSAEEVLKPELRRSLDEKLRVLLDCLPEGGKRHMAEGDWHPLHSSLYVWNKTQLANFAMILECDRQEMSHSVEGRVPFLDHHLTDYVNSLPANLKIHHDPNMDLQEDDSPWWTSDNESGLRQFREKWLLREAARPFLTDEIYERRKHLYTAPAAWPMGGPLYKRFEKLVTRESVEKLGFVSWEDVEPLLQTAFGDGGSHRAFRNLISVAAWVVLSQRFGIPRASV
ncbi:related to ASN2 - asparagine synthetase [Fusarium torulosum]|uniref:Related to ASN2 - asparagine synthetase n=1 Tax=Fusarium torulosum TaxID=33205 RepID=A0AAE8MAY3_9HYPO|nr:related to ASN2 - asparagine synthetase [Fusarium torulosum]